MFGAVMKSYFAEKIGVNPENMVSVSIMPCVAKKGEREMELFHGEYAGHDVDIGTYYKRTYSYDKSFSYRSEES